MAARFPPAANPSSNAHPQDYGSQSSSVHTASTERGGAANPPSLPPKHHPMQEVQQEEEDDIPPPMFPVSQRLLPSPVKVRASPPGPPHQHPQSRVPPGYVPTDGFGSQRHEEQRGWQHGTDQRVYANCQPHPGVSAQQSNRPMKSSSNVLPSSNGSKSFDLATAGIDNEISNVLVKLQREESMFETSQDAPVDPNLHCLVCRTTFKKGEIQKFKRHVVSCGKFI